MQKALEVRGERRWIQGLAGAALWAGMAGLLAPVASADDTAMVAGDIDAGKSKSAICAACHGADGNSFNPEWPRLAGQHAAYLVAQLEAYKSGARKNVLMAPQAAGLSDQDMLDLAAYYAAQTPKSGAADAALATAGERLYRGGNLDKGTSACAACHGPDGRGNLPAVIPALAGQHATYTKTTLQQYAAGERPGGRSNMMQMIASQLSPAEMDAVASFIQGLQ